MLGEDNIFVSGQGILRFIEGWQMIFLQAVGCICCWAADGFVCWAADKFDVRQGYYIRLEGNVGDMSATCRTTRHMSRVSEQHAKSGNILRRMSVLGWCQDVVVCVVHT